jgi:hypothetical protein
MAVINHPQTESDSPPPPTETPPLSDAERNAMRAYLQRCEVRLSTLHRIATAFLSGAGLLLLIPVFFKDAIDSLLVVILAQSSNQFEAWNGLGYVVTVVQYLAIGYLVILSMAIPLYGVYMLLKDIIHFYFTIYTPGFSENLLNPTFALTGVMFSHDESVAGKREVMRYQYDATQMGFMIPFSRERKELYFDSIIENSEHSIIPETRQIDHLEAEGVLPQGYDALNVERFNAALGIARSIDRTLAQEVAVTEMSLVRHVLYLRRLMFRYVKTLLMFIWTMVVAFMVLPFLRDPRFSPLLMLSLAYLIWVVAAQPIMRWPLDWIYKHRREKTRFDHVDPQLRSMNERLVIFCNVGIGLGVVALLLSTVAVFV